MLLTITCQTAASGLADARDIGFLLHKNPASFLVRPLSFGQARIFYPEASAERCTLAVQVEVDPVALVRGQAAAPAAQYVSDRPYVASSFLSVALSSCFASALAGRAPQKPELVDVPLDLEARLTPIACDGGPGLIATLLEPLGYTLRCERIELDAAFPEWGEGNLYDLTLTGRQTIHDLLSHLYVLTPALDNAKHYFVGEEEVEKLLRHGEGWLAAHPARELIARRYLRYRRTLTESALARLAEADGAPDESEAVEKVSPEEALETPVRLNDQRIDAALEAVRTLDPPAQTILDLGCGEGKTLAALQRALPRVALAGVDVSTFALGQARRRLRERATLWHGSLVYRDRRLEGFDVALLMEVIEHLDPPRLRALETSVFTHARPRRVLVTTPNAEYNSVWSGLPAGKMRHPDHRFEWTRPEFAAWAQRVAQDHGYRVALSGIGQDDPDGQGRGTPTQTALFDRP